MTVIAAAFVILLTPSVTADGDIFPCLHGAAVASLADVCFRLDDIVLVTDL